MQARGFRGEVRLLSEFLLRTRDYLAISGLAFAAAAAIMALQGLSLRVRAGERIALLGPTAQNE